MIRAVDEVHQFASSRAHQPEETDNLTATHIETRRFTQRVAFDVLYRKTHVAKRTRLVVVDIRNLSADHFLHE